MNELGSGSSPLTHRTIATTRIHWVLYKVFDIDSRNQAIWQLLKDTLPLFAEAELWSSKHKKRLILDNTRYNKVLSCQPRVTVTYVLFTIV